MFVATSRFPKLYILHPKLIPIFSTSSLPCSSRPPLRHRSPHAYPFTFASLSSIHQHICTNNAIHTPLHSITNYLPFIFLILIITPLIRQLTLHTKPPRDPQNQEPPKKIQYLQTSKQHRTNHMTQLTLILFILPIKHIRPHSLELIEL